MNILNGETYLLLVDGFASATDPNYTLTIGGTATLDCTTLDLVIDELSKNNLITKDTTNRKEEIIFSVDGKILWNKDDKTSDLKSYRGMYIILYDNGDRVKKIKY